LWGVFSKKFEEKSSNHLTLGAVWANIAWFAVLPASASVKARPLQRLAVSASGPMWPRQAQVMFECGQ
jgi:arginine exporter protein ArgO